MTLNGTNTEITRLYNQTLTEKIGEIACVQPSKSISVFIACQSLQSVKTLSKFLENDDLRKIFCAIFTGLASELDLQLKPATLFIDQSHLREAREYFQGSIK